MGNPYGNRNPKIRNTFINANLGGSLYARMVAHFHRNNQRDLFILQVFFGGLRGYKELDSARLIKHDRNQYKVSIYQNKMKSTVTNPLNVFSEHVLKKYEFQIPKLQRNNAQEERVVSSIDMLEEYYRSLLRVVAHVINFDRDILVDGGKHIHKPVKEIFAPYWARKTFGTICYQELRLRIEEIALFTGHKVKNRSELSASYVEMDTIENKKALLANLKLH